MECLRELSPFEANLRSHFRLSELEYKNTIFLFVTLGI